MALQMQRAFNYKMLTTMTLYTISAGSFDATNEWVEGSIVAAPFKGVLQAGNKFSQFEEGIALHEEVGGKRYSDFRSVFVTDKVVIAVEDKIGICLLYTSPSPRDS